MKIFKSISSIQKYLSTQSQIAFIPTMGNLHQGHLSLIRKAKKPKTCIVVSIFVNRLQFNDKKDFASYPKTLKQDLEYLKNECVDAVFIPTEQQMNINHSEFKLSFFNLDYKLCDAFRPGHFEGVIAIVMKFCNIIRPHYLFLGKKDYQQLFILKNLMREFCYPIKIMAVPTKREKNGLAMSSRNGLIQKKYTTKISELYNELMQIKKTCKSLIHIKKVELRAFQNLTKNGWIVDYVSVRSQKTLLSPKNNEKKLVALIAAHLGNVRLIDNIEFCI